MTPSKRKPFQQATVEHVLGRLRAMGSKKRFLVADEVGLGKTLVAQGVLAELTNRPSQGRPPVVFYMCSSKTIAEQNRPALLSMIPTDDERASVNVKVDRLGLVPASTPPSPHARFHFYPLTPGITSGDGTGRVEERALLVHVLCEISSTLRRRSRWKMSMQRRVKPATWERAQASVKLVDRRVLQRFRRGLCEELDLAAHARDFTFAEKVESTLEKEPLTAIEAMRRSMTFAVIGVLQPDIVILDEFQRFFEFLPAGEDTLAEEEDAEDAYADARRVMRAVLAGVSQLEKRKPYVIMLSATPYRLYSRSMEGGRHHDEFYTLLDFLYDDGGHASRAIKENFLEYGERLLNDPPGSAPVTALRAKLERKLFEVMCRTERDALVQRRDATVTSEIPATLAPLDIRAFKVLSDIATPAKLGAEPYWSSIPFAYQAMDEQYAIRRKGVVPAARPGDAAVRLDYRSVRRYREPRHGYPHPRLRKLIDVISPSVLALPWLPPTRPWWPLGGPFAIAPRATKTLIFSRFRAVPRVLAAVLSYEAEKKAFAGRPFDYAVRSHGSGDQRAKALEGLRPQPSPTLGLTFKERRDEAIRSFLLFAPLPALAAIGDPLRIAARATGDLTQEVARAAVRRDLERVLLGGRPPATGGARWSRLLGWVAAIERSASSWAGLKAGVERWATAREEEHEDGGSKVCRHFVETAATSPSGVPTTTELDELANLALAAPGAVCSRAFGRVYGAAAEPLAEERVYLLLDAGLTAMRAYLDASEWRAILSPQARGGGTSRTPFSAALLRAVWDGNLESVLDELFASYSSYALPAGLTEKQQMERERAALDRLKTALSIHGAQVTIQHLRRKPASDASSSFRMRCHAAAPLGLAPSEVAEENEALRGDRLRVAFNSPFRPMALVTTSIGQEGLDFHTYARRIVHWDLPSSPVELEQRDGRIARFASHAIRIALAQRADAPALDPVRSPWLALGSAAAASEDDSGIEPWWTAPQATIERVFLVPPFSKLHADIRRLHAALGMYRVVLGQPGQERLLGALQARIDTAPESEKSALRTWYEHESICLSPFLRRDRVTRAAE